MTTTMLAEISTTAGVRWIDLAALAVMGLLWLFVLGLLFGIFKILRSKARGDSGWGDSPGMT